MDRFRWRAPMVTPRSRSCRAFVWRALPICASLALITGPALTAQRSRPTQYDVEAAYLYQFVNFVQWPPSKSNAEGPKSFLICVLGRDPFGKTLDDTIKGETLNGMALAARRIASAQEAADCRVLFVSSSLGSEVTHDLDILRRSPVLTASDMPDFLRSGGMIQFVLIDNRVRFEIDVGNAQRAGLTLSSQLLKVALSIHGQPKPK
jgi:YfiR/HmsC-like